MANTIDSNEFVLIHRWPTKAQDWAPPKAQDPANDGGHNVVAAKYKIGTTWEHFQAGSTGINEGWVTFTYLKLGTQDDTVVLAAKGICAIAVAPGAATAAEVLYTVTNADATAILGSTPAAVALSAMTNSYYGWFWTGGPCPESIVSGLAGSYETTAGVVAGGLCTEVSANNGTVIGFGTAILGGACGISFVSNT